MQEVLPRFRASITAYFEALDALGRRLIRLLALALGLEEDWFDDKFDMPIALLRPLHYSGRLSQPDEVRLLHVCSNLLPTLGNARWVLMLCCWRILQGIFGCGAHTDYGALTILATDGSPGALPVVSRPMCHPDSEASTSAANTAGS